MTATPFNSTIHKYVVIYPNVHIEAGAPIDPIVALRKPPPARQPGDLPLNSVEEAA